MKLSDIRRDPATIEAGTWVKDIPGMGDLEVRVRGKDNADWRRLEAKLIARVPREARENGRISIEQVDRITGMLLLDACLIGWNNLTDDAGPVLYSYNKAEELLTKPEFKAFRDAVLWAATLVADGQAQATADAVKN